MANQLINNRQTVIFLMGPTASGKTSLAVELHKSLPVEIVSVDSAMVYRGLDIGTAKPSKAIQKETPHRLIDICDPDERYSAGRFCNDAVHAINEIHTQGRVPLLVGGTGLYFRSLEQGFSDLPIADQDIRRRLESEAQEYGWEKMHARLHKVDPDSAARIHRNDPQRIQRALEIYEITGKPMSELHQKGRTSPLDLQIIKLVIGSNDRAILHQQIQTRYHDMLESGLIEEVRQFYERSDMSQALPSMRLVGYRQVWQYLAGEINYNIMVNKAITATRQLAKRQLTWLRSEKNAHWFDGNDLDLKGNLLKILHDNAFISARL